MGVLTASDTFNKVRIVGDKADGFFIMDIAAYQNSTLVGALQWRSGGFPDTHESFITAKEAIESGAAVFEYEGTDDNVYAAHVVPSQFQWMIDQNPIKRAIDNEQGAAAEDIGPLHSVVFTTASATTAPTAYPPVLSTSNRTLLLWRTALVNAGFSLTPPSTIPEGEVVWATHVELQYNSGTGQYTTTYSTWDTNAIMWTQGGIGEDPQDGGSWTVDPPANLNTVVAIRIYDHAHHRWVRVPYAQNLHDVYNPDQYNFNAWQEFAYVWNNTGPPLYVPAPQLTSDSVPRIYIRWLEYAFESGGWDLSTERYDYYGELLPNWLVAVTPDLGEHDDGTIVEAISGHTYLFTMHEDGSCRGGRVRGNRGWEAVTVGQDGVRGKFQGFWEFNPQFQTEAAATASQQVIRVNRKPVGVATAMRFHVASTGEQMNVSAINIARQGTSPNYYWDLTFDRGVSGTTAAAIAEGATLWGVYDHSSLWRFVITRREGLTSACKISTGRVFDRI